MHVLITGASSGIGASVAAEYLGRGAVVTLVARRGDRLAAIAERAGAGRAHAIVADLADHDRVPAVVAEAEGALGPIDVLVNNAGMQLIGATRETDWEAAERLLRVNVMAPLRLTRAVLPGMVARRAGAIVDVASVAALMPPPGMTFYSASKGGLAAASEGMRAELAAHGVHVVTVYPGPVRTDMDRAAREAYAPSATVARLPLGTPEVLARRIAEAVERRRPRVIYPRVYILSRYLPGVARWVADTLTPPLK